MSYDIPPGVSKNPKKADAQPILDLATELGVTGWCFNGKNKKFYRVAEVAKD
jgi:hypothetical protein